MKTVIELAKEAGFVEPTARSLENFERFAALIRAEREWVDLTDDELLTALVGVDASTARLPIGFRLFAHAVIAKFKEKNK